MACRHKLLIVACAASLLGLSTALPADQSSAGYKNRVPAFTSGVRDIGSSAHYLQSTLAGPVATGSSSSANYSVHAGFQPALTAQFVNDTLLPHASLSASALDFGGQSMGTTSAVQTITLTNDGGAALTISSISVSNNQFVQTNNCTSVAPAATCTIMQAFSPAPVAVALNSTVTVTGVLMIASNGLGSPNTVSLAGTGERSLVTHYYRSILRRAPDSGGRTYWEGEASRLASLGANVNEAWFALALSFFGSNEYNSLGRDNSGFVADLYNTFFNRSPDTAGLTYWTGLLGSGMPREVALVSFMFSNEFRTFAQSIFGSTAARAEVDTVGDFYRGLLARLPDSSGFNFWVGQFRTAQCQGANAVYSQVEAISSAYADSTEYSARGRTNAQYVGDLYNAFLRRGGDLEGVLFWINQLGSGAMTRSQLRQTFISSPEFSARVAAIIAQGCLQ